MKSAINCPICTKEERMMIIAMIKLVSCCMMAVWKKGPKVARLKTMEMTMAPEKNLGKSCIKMLMQNAKAWRKERMNIWNFEKPCIAKERRNICDCNSVKCDLRVWNNWPKPLYMPTKAAQRKK